MWATSVIFIELLKANNHPLGEFSPNLVTLPIYLSKSRFCYYQTIIT
jgi:hypothetical protein